MEVSLDSVDDLGLAQQPTYRIDQSFEWNAQHGPSFAGPYPHVPETPLKDFFGLPVKSRFGLAASLGMTADWIGLYARLGFDILTYKTVRGRVRRAHAPPNWIFLDETGLALDQFERPCRTITGVPATPGLATAVGSIGTPSSDPAFLAKRYSSRPAALGTRTGADRLGDGDSGGCHERGRRGRRV